ncbi:MAG: acyl-CoA dehydrogenase family protein [Pseudomonadota bacterium]
MPLGAETEAVLDTAARVFSDHAEAREPLWRALEDTGLTLAATPEAQGGVGLPPEAVFSLHRAAGAAAVPVPLAETLTARRLLAAAGMEAPEGPLTFACGGSVSGGRLTAELYDVPFAGAAPHIVVLAEAAGAPTLALARVAQAESDAPSLGSLPPARPKESQGGAEGGRIALGLDPEADLSFDAAPILASAPIAWDADAAQAEAALMRAAQIAGAMDAALSLTLAHTTAREQFGRALSKFQAIQHMLSEMAGEIAAATAAVEAAAETAGPLTAPDRIAAGAAKLRASEAAGLVAAHAHQCHGAIGYTADYALNRLTRRLWRWREQHGDETFWAVEIGRAAAAPNAPSLRRWIFGGPT